MPNMVNVLNLACMVYLDKETKFTQIHKIIEENLFICVGNNNNTNKMKIEASILVD